MQLIHGDCLEKKNEGYSRQIIDMILCDLPLRNDACKWDVIIPLNLMGTI